LKYGLGIDAGGTYTDAVIYDLDNNKVVSSIKTITNRENLGKSINEVLDNFSEDILMNIKLISLSTTLTTNSCIEDKGSKATLVLIGCNEKIISELGYKYGLPSAEEMIFVEGEHRSDGSVKTFVDLEELKSKVMKYKDSTNGFAVVELGGVYNPEFEIEAKKLIETSTGLYTINANAISRELNFMKRATSALINAQMIPIINDFLDSVKYNLKIRNITAPLLIVRGDGTLMSEKYARTMPVETILSGPAASVVGAIKLSGNKNCVVVDMGGTTSDLSVINEGIVKFASKGIKIGKWQTGTKSIEMKPIGLGGDSHITFNNKEELFISVRRTLPLCCLASKFPKVMDEMQEIYNEHKINTLSLCEFFYLLKDVKDLSIYNKWEIPIINALKDGPLSVEKLATIAGISKYNLNIDNLEKYGVVMRSALTPTDIMHLTGDFERFDVEASYLGASILAKRLGKTLEEIKNLIYKKVKEKLYLNIVGVLLENEDELFHFNDITPEYESLILKGFYENRRGNINVNLFSKLSLVGIGAPIHIFLPEVASKLHAECVIPENAAVANAVGAVTGIIAVEEIVLIKPIYETSGISGYSCSSLNECNSFLSYEEAVEWSKKQAETLAYNKALQRGASKGEVKVTFNIDETEFTPGYKEIASTVKIDSTEIDGDKGHMLLETKVVARAIGNLSVMITQ